MTNILVIDESRMPLDLDLAIRETLAICFQKDADYFSKQRGWHGSMPFYTVYMQDDDGKVVAHASVVDRTIRVGMTPLRIAGVQNVAVLPQCRGTGMSERIMNEAVAEAFRRVFDGGLLFCFAKLVKVYEACGWSIVENRRVIRIDENGNEVALPEGSLPMWHALLRVDLPDGDIHLQGNDW